MAGSITNKVYTSDDGVSYNIRIDESNAEGEVSNYDNPCCDNLSTPLPDLPRGLTPRYFLATLALNPLIKRKFILGNPAGVPGGTSPGATILAPYVANSDGTPGAAITWRITYYRGEARRVTQLVNADTGITDGDSN